VSLKVFVFLLPGYLESFRALFHLVYVPLGAAGSMENAMSIVWGGAALLLVKMVLPLLCVPFSIMVASLVPGGWVLSGSSLAPDFGRVSPMRNLGQIFSGKHWTTFGVSIAKAAVLATVLSHVVRSSTSAWVDLQRMPLHDGLMRGAAMMFDGLMSLVAVFLLFAVIDVPLQAFLFAKGQRMSKQEQKEEYKSSEGKPEVKARIRQLQNQMARRNVNKTVPTADVVIVNPEHYAVALKYDANRAEAPPTWWPRASTRWRCTSARSRRRTTSKRYRCRRWRARSTTRARCSSRFPPCCTRRCRRC
jgi:flagellar biosynthetic protein FlhB